LPLAKKPKSMIGNWLRRLARIGLSPLFVTIWRWL
jgi:hypothetical protein